MKKTRLTKVLALTLVMLMVMSTAAYAATGAISNTLSATFNVKAKQATNLTVIATTRNAVNNTDRGGYQVNLTFSDGTRMVDLDKLEVSLYRENSELVKNIYRKDRASETDNNNNKTTSPFNIGGGDVQLWAWDRGAFPFPSDQELNDSVLPTKVVVDFVKDGLSYTFTQAVQLSLPLQSELPLVSIRWDLGTEPIAAEAGEIINAPITAKVNGRNFIDTNLVVKITDENGIAVDDVLVKINEILTNGKVEDVNTFEFVSGVIRVNKIDTIIDLEITFNATGTYSVQAYILEAIAE